MSAPSDFCATSTCSLASLPQKTSSVSSCFWVFTLQLVGGLTVCVACSGNLFLVTLGLCGASAFSSYFLMDKTFVNVPTLRTADDFPAWKQAVWLACMSLDVWDCVTGDEAEPENRDLQHIFRRSDWKAFATLQLSIAPNLLQVVKEAQTSRQTLEALEAHFGDASLSNKVFLKRSLFKLQQDELQSSRRYLTDSCHR